MSVATTCPAGYGPCTQPHRQWAGVEVTQATTSTHAKQHYSVQHQRINASTSTHDGKGAVCGRARYVGYRQTVCILGEGPNHSYRRHAEPANAREGLDALDARPHTSTRAAVVSSSQAQRCSRRMTTATHTFGITGRSTDNHAGRKPRSPAPSGVASSSELDTAAATLTCLCDAMPTGTQARRVCGIRL